MIKQYKKIISFSMATLMGLSLFAQEETKKTPDVPGLSGITKNVIIGYAYSDFVISPKSDIKTNFTRVGFSPTMIWKLGDHLFFESQVEFYTDSGIVHTQVEYAKLSYMINKYMAIGMGKMMTPFGTYSERLEVSFIERMPNAPLGFRPIEGTPCIGPTGSEMGLDLRGGFQVGDAKMNYTVYVSNGGKLYDGTAEPKLAGALQYENYFDNNSNKAIGGRVGYLPLSNSSLELGLSTNYSKVGDVKTKYENVAAKAYAVDLSYHRAISPIKSLINLKGQYNYLMVDKAEYINEEGDPYTFENNSSIYYVRFSIRPALVKNKYLKRVELLGRYNVSNLPKEALWGGTTTRTDIGFSYWLSLRTGLRVAYEATQYPGGTKSDAVLVRFVTGF
ncbi:MAG: hypothetical protein CFE21_01760 [Bacteroidetes bacterium B1(2017)]|nr:MAG: hypothetical protein CFE21_01760 [Bacteroidetes bacterium B1(2017)]